VGVSLGVGVEVGSSVGARVGVGVSVAVGVEVGISVAVGVKVGISVAVGGDWVAVGAGRLAIPGTNQTALAWLGSPPFTSTLSIKRTRFPACWERSRSILVI
jgi:hypothetical protein